MHMLVANWLSDAFSDAYSDAKFNAFESQPRHHFGPTDIGECAKSSTIFSCINLRFRP